MSGVCKTKDRRNCEGNVLELIDTTGVQADSADAALSIYWNSIIKEMDGEFGTKTEI